jgi:SpoVK/Ycf46/Vps4 family AAA+-type ATPase
MSAILGSDGEDKLKKVFEACRENQPAAVVLDDIDVMFSKESSKRPQGSLLPMLMGWLDRLHKEKTLVFATCSSPEKL